MPQRDVYTVSRLNREVREWLEEGFTLLWIEGEISNLAQPASGHLYFSLKDADAQIRCAMFRQRNRLLPFRPANGQHVLVRGRVGLYEPRGDFQLIVETMQEHGEGDLRLAYERLKKRLAAAGLFDQERKRPIPALPHQIGIVTSPTGAAIQDILAVTRRRFPGIPLVIYPVPVQGAGAGDQIARMIDLAGRRGECDVLIVARGGGSLEDLWAFNEEVVARAIAESPIPVVTGIGHDIDHSIADLAADLAMPTPSAAAEHVTPDRLDCLRGLREDEARLRQRMTHVLVQYRERLAWLQHRLRMQHPEQRLQQQMQRLDEWQLRLQRAIGRELADRRRNLRTARARLSPLPIQRRIGTGHETLGRLRPALQRATATRIESARQRLARQCQALDELSPLATLSRGYAVAQRARDGHLIRHTADIAPGERLRLRVSDGHIACLAEEGLDD